jgi:CheY-like chemotaxis protein
VSNEFEISSEDKGELLDNFAALAEKLISCEREGVEGHKDEILRLLHNLKGTMQMIGFDQLGEFIHLLESKFPLINKGNLSECIDMYLISVNSLEQHFIDEMDCYDDHLYKQIEKMGQLKEQRPVETVIRDIIDSPKMEERIYEKIDSTFIPEDVGVVFVLDDDKEILKSVKESFSNLNMVVMTFSNFETFLSTMSDIKPDLIMIDYHLGDIKGVDVYNAHIKRREIPTIFMTSDIRRQTFEDILKGKNVFFLEKPLRYFEVISSVVSALEQGKMRGMIDRMIDLERTILSHFPEIKGALEEKEDFKSIYEIREAYRMLMKYRKLLMK